MASNGSLPPNSYKANTEILHLEPGASFVTLLTDGARGLSESQVARIVVYRSISGRNQISETKTNEPSKVRSSENENEPNIERNHVYRGLKTKSNWPLKGRSWENENELALTSELIRFLLEMDQ